MSSVRPITAVFVALGAALLTNQALAQDATALNVGPRRDVVFTDYTPLSGSAELVRRMLSPLAALEVQRALTRSGKALTEQSVDLSKERFTLYVPAQAPPHGYGLLAFVSPDQDAPLPPGWAAVLDRYGVIFVSAARSGNDEDVLGRREPLALLAAENVMRRYTVDPERVYVGGFSGGSRIAMRLALGYPDLFRGALLNAGSDPIGDGPPAPPPRELFEQFQASTRLVYFTGEHDPIRLQMDAVSLQSMRAWCVFGVHAQVDNWVLHEQANAAALSRALDALLKPARADPDRLATCRSGVEAELAAKLRQVESLIAAGRRDEARELLFKLDGHFGGLAAPRSVELLAR